MPVLGDIFMLAGLQIEFRDAILCTGEDDLGRVDALNVCRHSKRLLRVNDPNRIRPLVQIDDVQSLVVDILYWTS